MEEYNPKELADKILDNVRQDYKNFTKLNVMVLGKTGVGKSTLINNMFSKNVAETGIGKPVTSNIRKYELPEYPMAIYDTPGFELNGDNDPDNLLKQIKGEIQKGIKSNDLNNTIHCIWYCVSTASHRFEQSEIDFIEELLNEIEEFNVPVIIVLTQSYAKNDWLELKSSIEKENLNITSIVPVLAEDYNIDDNYTAKAFGLAKLANIMNNVIPESVRKTFIALQKADIELKKNKAEKIVAGSAVAAAGIGATPIPFSDAFLLIPEQVAMFAGITATFGLPLEKATLASIISATIGSAGATVLGKTIVTGIIKLIPGAGTIVGGVISGATAAALTSALGEAYIAILVSVSKGEMSFDDITTETGKNRITQIFKDRLKIERNSDGQPK